MKKYLNILFLIGLIILVGTPFKTFAGNLNIMTSDGYNIGLNKPYSGFYVDGAGNVTFMLEGTRAELPEPFQYEPIITISGTNTNNNTGTVSGTVGNQVVFTIEATDSAGTPNLSCLSPADNFQLDQSSINKGTFAKTFNTAGTYFAIFKAQYSDFPTQRVVKISVTDPGAPPPVCQVTINVSINGTGGQVSPMTQTVNCSTSANFTVAMNTGVTATVSIGSLSGTTWTIPAGPTSSTINATITFSSSTPPPGMTGRWAAQVASATKLNGTTGRPGYYGVEYVGINMNQTKYFLIDPKNFNIPHAGAYIFGWVMDLTQCAGININYPRMIKLNANADEITWWYLTGACSYSLTKAYSSTDWNNGVMFLIEVTEMGRGSSAQGLNIYWQYR